MVKTKRYNNVKKYMKSRKTRKNRRKRGGGTRGWGEDCSPVLEYNRSNVNSLCNKDIGLECLPKIFRGNTIGTANKCAFPKTTLGIAKWLHSN